MKGRYKFYFIFALLLSNCISFYKDENKSIVTNAEIKFSNDIDITFRAFYKNGKNNFYDKFINDREIFLQLDKHNLFHPNIKIYDFNDYLKVKQKSKHRIDLIFHLNQEEIGFLKGIWAILHITSSMIIPFAIRTDIEYLANFYDSESKLLKQVEYKNSRLDIANLFFVFIPSNNKIDPEEEFIKNTMIYFRERIAQRK